jgi:hypothetical protein
MSQASERSLRASIAAHEMHSRNDPQKITAGPSRVLG